jgi:RimJ/RimL family protein N-acetyltransferase
MIPDLPTEFSTTSLHLQTLSITHASFIFELLNSPGWLTYIGNRNIHNMEAAENYIAKITAMPQVQYWVVSQKSTALPIGIITLIKRDYLPHHDVGFAFLPAAQGKGLASEAATCVVNYLMQHQYPILLATTLPANTASVKLLSKLGFSWQQQIIVGADALAIYTIQKA